MPGPKISAAAPQIQTDTPQPHFLSQNRTLSCPTHAPAVHSIHRAAAAAPPRLPCRRAAGNLPAPSHQRLFSSVSPRAPAIARPLTACSSRLPGAGVIRRPANELPREGRFDGHHTLPAVRSSATYSLLVTRRSSLRQRARSTCLRAPNGCALCWPTREVPTVAPCDPLPLKLLPAECSRWEGCCLLDISKARKERAEEIDKKCTNMHQTFCFSKIGMDLLLNARTGLEARSIKTLYECYCVTRSIGWPFS
ncbi:uncharacterized protein LOC124705415 [Lolium rigidum]|uniref:uncharacterized protein LOC124705415 n=1 Tax=Lolium rigidum TaxID=89674 RepID=UPI001F5CAE10|nr:uncharacterized protein LOC124705415 [Lolium rigidum]